MNRCILDSNILKPLFKGQQPVVQLAQKHQSLHGTLYITILTYYEVMRGLTFLAQAKETTVRTHAKQRIHYFEEFCYRNTILDLTKDACNHAAHIYGSRKREGLPYNLGHDILIAGIALVGNYTVVTQNVSDFASIPKLSVENWLA